MSEAKLIEAQDALERERRRAAQATTALEASHREIEKLRGDAEQARRLSEALAREKGRADAAAQELGRLKGELAGLRQSESRLAEASASIENERRRAKAAVAEVALLKSEKAKLLAKRPNWSKPSNAKSSEPRAVPSRSLGWARLWRGRRGGPTRRLRNWAASGTNSPLCAKESRSLPR